MMSTAEEDNQISSPSLVTLVARVRSQFKRNKHTGFYPDQVIISAEEVARIYRANQESPTADELTFVFEVLKDFEIQVVSIPKQFNLHVANVIRCLEAKDPTKTDSHVMGVIFSQTRMGR